jgi:broad specificity phosphatase PhoE
MSTLYLVRHGQAGTRENYDTLSGRGRTQARLLAAYFRREGIRFAAAYSGSLQRQCETAQEVLGALSAPPEISVDAGWNEFDLDAVLREFAPFLAAEDEQFSRDYAAMQQAIADSAGRHDAPVHRRWYECDKQAVLAWVHGRYAPPAVESWREFEARIRAAFSRVSAAHPEGDVVVFTSATPIAICAAATLDAGGGEPALRIAGVLHNASFSTLRIHRGGARLHSLNAIPHLDEPDLRTFR